MANTGFWPWRTIHDSGSRGVAATGGEVGLQIVRDWRFNAQDVDGLIDRKAPGQRPKLTAEQR